MFSAGLALAVAGLWFVPTFLLSRGAYSMMVSQEFVHRVVKGYHNTETPWYYLRIIFTERLTVPPLLGLAAVACALGFAAFRRDRRFVFLTVWALTPIVLFSCVSSKLPWYLMPSLPPLAILVGWLLRSVWLIAMQNLLTSQRSLQSGALAAAALIFLLWSGGEIWGQLADNAKVVVGPYERKVHDRIARYALKRRLARRGQPIVLYYNDPEMANPEKLYFGMLGVTRVGRLQELAEALHSGHYRYVVTYLENVPEVLKLRRPDGYAVLPPAYRRRNWAAVIAFGPEAVSPALTPVRIGLTPVAKEFRPAFNASPRQESWGDTVLDAHGPTSGFLLPGDALHRAFGTTLAVSAHLARELTISAFLNSVPVGSAAVLPGHRVVDYVVPENAWQHGTNLLQLKYSYSDGSAVEDGDVPITLTSVVYELRLPEAAAK
jgi:hypothetical protein